MTAITSVMLLLMTMLAVLRMRRIAARMNNRHEISKRQRR